MKKKIPLSGRTVGQALDALVVADHRYSWREQDGVLVIRPIEQWNQATNFLNQSVEPIDERQQRPMDILTRLYIRRGLPLSSGSGGTLGNPTRRSSDLNQSISVTLPAPTMLDVLNAITKSHAQLIWMVASVRQSEEFESRCLYLITFDGQFKGIGADCGRGF
jgi:hypothetical protein